MCRLDVLIKLMYVHLWWRRWRDVCVLSHTEVETRPPSPSVIPWYTHFSVHLPCGQGCICLVFQLKLDDPSYSCFKYRSWSTSLLGAWKGCALHRWLDGAVLQALDPSKRQGPYLPSYSAEAPTASPDAMSQAGWFVLGWPCSNIRI